MLCHNHRMLDGCPEIHRIEFCFCLSASDRNESLIEAKCLCRPSSVATTNAQGAKMTPYGALSAFGRL
jgi:hypothetical protein